MRASGIVVALLLLGACDRRPPPAPPAPAAAGAHPPTVVRVEIVRRPAVARVVAVGDVHGDLGATRAALRAAHLLGDDDHWSGGTAVLVQTGDILDRGDDEPDIMALFDRLTAEAHVAGGDVVRLLGNHELMNAAGDFRYVTPGAFADYGDKAGRARAFAPGSPLDVKLAEEHVYVIIGDTLFVHGGVEPDVVARLAAIDDEARAWLAGTSDAHHLPAALTDEHSPLWSRRFAQGESPEICADATHTLASLGITRMVVGHTPQPHGVSKICHDTVVRIDVGLASYYEGPIEVIEITGGQVTVDHGQR